MESRYNNSEAGLKLSAWERDLGRHLTETEELNLLAGYYPMMSAAQIRSMAKHVKRYVSVVPQGWDSVTA